MPDVYLRIGDANASDITLRDPTTQDAGGPINLAVGRADEVDTALARGFALATGRVDETDLALSVSATKQIATARADETDTALAVAKRKSVATGRADETDTALAFIATKRLVLGLSAETDSSLAPASVKHLATGVADETDAAQAMQFGSSGLQVTAAVETDTALALTITPGFIQTVPLGFGRDRPRREREIRLFAIRLPVGLAEERDEAAWPELRKRLLVSPVVLVDEAHATSVWKRIEAKRSSEWHEAARPLVIAKPMRIRAAISDELAHARRLTTAISVHAAVEYAIPKRPLLMKRIGRRAAVSFEMASQPELKESA